MKIIVESKSIEKVLKLMEDSNGEIIGRAVISEHKNYVRLHLILVDKNYRGRGFGTKLLEEVLSLYHDKDITLQTFLGNEGWFQKYGFKVVNKHDGLISMIKPVTNFRHHL